jgi:hypothetical protein
MLRTSVRERYPGPIDMARDRATTWAADEGRELHHCINLLQSRKAGRKFLVAAPPKGFHRSQGGAEGRVVPANWMEHPTC